MSVARAIFIFLVLGLWADPVPGQDTTTVAAPDGALDGVTDFLGHLFDLSASNVTDKLLRIAAILAIVVIAKYFTSLVRLVSRFIVYSDWGPLRYICRDHARSVMIHRLVISMTKYVVYLTALGYILTELGVNYTTFLASLSLVGIAVGFGSQGLVQDVVTGFFILFENQFRVGDMVEVSGQTGIVEEIGLRTTRIRNYFGAQMTFQNRNIQFSGRYAKGALEAYVDVAVGSPDQASRAGELLEEAGAELGRQFEEVILERPVLHGVVDLKTKELFVRLHLKIWPGQQWVVDTQMLPRVREIFKREGVEIPGDRIVAFYHLPPGEGEGKRIVRNIKTFARRATERGLFREDPSRT